MWKLTLLGNNQEFYCTRGSIQISKFGTKDFLWQCGRNGASFINLGFFPVLYFIGQAPDIGCQTQGRVWGGERRCLHIRFNASCQGISSGREPQGHGGEEQPWRWVCDSVVLPEHRDGSCVLSQLRETWFREYGPEPGGQMLDPEAKGSVIKGEKVYFCGRSGWLD